MIAHDDSPRNRVYKAYWQDGSIDLFAGLALATIGACWLTDNVAIGAVAPAIAVPIWASFRQKVIEPRIGYVRFDEARRAEIRRGHVALFALGCAAFVLGLVGFFTFGGAGTGEKLLQATIRALPAVLVGIGAGLAAVLLSLPRFLIYAAACVAAGAVVAAIDVNPGWSLLTGGCVAAIAGAAMLVRFLNHFPPLSRELE